MEAKTFTEPVLFIGLQIANAEPLAIEGGENHEDFHVTLAYGHFDRRNIGDEDDLDSRVQSAIDDIRDLIPDKIQFDAMGRFEASESSDGKDVIYAQVAAGQLEEAHDGLLKALKERSIKMEDTFPTYKPHMTLAYIEPGTEFELEKINGTGTVVKIMIGHGSESSHENSYTIKKTDNDKRLVFGWASVSIKVDGEQLEDLQKDMIDPEDLEEAAYEYVLNFRDTGEEHIPTMRKKGKLVESCVLTAEKQKAMGIPEGTLPIGWWIGFKIEDDEAWERVKNGTYKMFSIEGRATREPVEKTAEREKAVEKADRYDYITEVPVAKSFSDVLKFNPYHDASGRFASAPGGGGGGRAYGSTDTSDAAAEIAGGKANSLAGYIGADGKLTPEREAVHKKIIDDLLAGKEPVQGQATMTMLGGGPASGKSSVMNPDTSNNKNAVTVDPDDIKKRLPGFKEMAEKDPNAASFYHEESSALAKRFSEVAYKENYDVIYDGTGDGSNKSVQKKIDAARANGYRVEAKYVSIDTEEAVRRNQKRYDDAVAKGETPRLPPVDMVRATHTKCTDISVSMASKFDSIEIWDNNGARGQQKMIASGGSGKGLTVVPGQEAAFTRYLSKGANGTAGFTTLPDGQVVPISG